MQTEPKIIYEEKDFLIVEKPAGLLTHRTKYSVEPTLADWLVERYPELARVGDDSVHRPGIVHRLDRETSGILVVPRNQQAFEYFKSLFASGKIAKTYLAVVYGVPKQKSGVISMPIGIKAGSIRRSVHSGKMAKAAVTEYKAKKTFNRGGESFSLVEVTPRTGRTHQIRVHLAAIGHPIVGDLLYGKKKVKRTPSRLMLHALSLEFSTPDGRRLKFEADPPADFLSTSDSHSACYNESN